jgi:putative addiction module killer protein
MGHMIVLKQTTTFNTWFDGLRDSLAQKRILVRLGRLELGNFGDAKSVGAGVSELRIPHGPGYRLYFTRRGQEVVLLLCGGDKGSQSRDIALAQKLAQKLAQQLGQETE